MKKSGLPHRAAPRSLMMWNRGTLVCADRNADGSEKRRALP
jgi:hypothetical protein